MTAGDIKVTRFIVDPVTENQGVSAYEATVSNFAKDAIEMILSLDIYAYDEPSHPDRHLGYWNMKTKLSPGENHISVKLIYPDVTFEINGHSGQKVEPWVGGFKKTGPYMLGLHVYDPSIDGPSPAISSIEKMQFIQFNEDDLISETLKSWPGARQRVPGINTPDYLTGSSLTRVIKQFVDEQVPDECRVLDVGCGTKPYYPYFMTKNVDYTGVDLMPTPFADVVNSSEILPFGDGEFDVVISTQVFEHIPEPQATADEIYRVLKPGGVGLISAPLVWEPHDWPYDFWRYTPGGLEKLFAAFGDKEIKPNGSTIQGLIQQWNIFISRRWGKPYDPRFIRKTIFFVNNVFGKYFGKARNDYAMSPNYTIIVKKGGA